jgi:polar amino acid transport system substrate-binding protein
MLVNKDYAPLVGIINNVIPLITEQDRKIIFEKWVAIEYVKGIDWVFFWSIIGGVLLLASIVIAIVMVWNNTLRHEIRLRKEAESKLQYLAMVDSLTGLANRNKFYEKLDTALMFADRQKIPVALAAIDLDDFKRINDQYGHPAGDIVLVEASRRLEKSCREVDTVARLGGDEFSIIVVAPNIETGLIKLGDRILENFSKPIDFEGSELTIGISIGFAIYKDHAQCKDSLVSYADKALYKAKGQGKNNFCIYQPTT